MIIIIIKSPWLDNSVKTKNFIVSMYHIRRLLMLSFNNKKIVTIALFDHYNL